MAELHVQKKEATVWPWILLALIVLALLLWYFLGRGDDNEFDVGVTDLTDSTMVGTAPNIDAEYSAAGTVAGASVQQYMQFVNDRGSRASGMAHEYTADGLRLLADALDDVAAGDSVNGVALQPRIAEIRERADAMRQNATSSEHSLQAREAFVLAASLIGQMHANANSGGNSESVQNAAMSIEPSQGLLDQTDQVEQFFSRAGDALRNLNGTM